MRKTLRKMRPFFEFFWFAFSRIRTEHRDLQSPSTYLVRMRENTDQNNSEYGQLICCKGQAIC